MGQPRFSSSSLRRFYYATNAEIFDYEDAVKSTVITENSVYNPSAIDLYVKIDGQNTVLKAGERISCK